MVAERRVAVTVSTVTVTASNFGVRDLEKSADANSTIGRSDGARERVSDTHDSERTPAHTTRQPLGCGWEPECAWGALT